MAERIEQYPPNWVAQPVLSLSTMPTLCDGNLVARHVDLRPFTLLGPEEAYVTSGGLTRVARTAGSLIVNSSQGGGSKDTWIVDSTIADRDVDGCAAPAATELTVVSGARSSELETTPRFGHREMAQ